MGEYGIQTERDGLMWYRPSNGTEFDIFLSRCQGCRHMDYDDNDYETCQFNILDRIVRSAWTEEYDRPEFYHHPDEVDVSTCPATCLKFTPKDYDGDDRDPPHPDCPGQMMLGEAIEIHEPEICAEKCDTQTETAAQNSAQTSASDPKQI